VYLMPPYILNSEEISLVGERMLKVFNQVMGEAA
jgi:adenosylmethionine-8-amino-7-oxononanoate aminotransferase